MKRIAYLSSSVLATLAVLLAFAANAGAQFYHSPAKTTVDVSAYPPDMQHGYRTFADKCSECHALFTSLKASRSQAGWAGEVRRMQDMASSHIDDREAHEITKFLAYYDLHKPAPQAVTTGSGGLLSGKELFDTLSCSACHSIAGQGNTSFSLDGIGSRRTASEIRKMILSPPASSAMPAITAPKDQIESLVGYLVTLKNQ